MGAVVGSAGVSSCAGEASGVGAVQPVASAEGDEPQPPTGDLGHLGLAVRGLLSSIAEAVITMWST